VPTGREQNPRPDHVIAPNEVSSWLADSAVRTVTYHCTSWQAAERIRERGVDPERSRVGSFGQGFYTATVREEEFGSTCLTEAVRLQTPLFGSFAEVEQIVDAIAARLNPLTGRISVAIAAGIRRELLRLGDDGIIVPDGGGDGIDWVIALRADAVKVVDE
jgi:hypothetical protein